MGRYPFAGRRDPRRGPPPSTRHWHDITTASNTNRGSSDVDIVTLESYPLPEKDTVCRAALIIERVIFDFVVVGSLSKGTSARGRAGSVMWNHATVAG